MENNVSDFIDVPPMWIETAEKNTYIGAVRSFDLKSMPSKATLSLFVDSRYKLYVNGKFVNAGPTPFKKPAVFVDTYDIHPYLQQGKNTVFIHAHFIGETIKAYSLDVPGIQVRILIQESSDTTKIVSDNQWRLFPLAAWNRNTPRKTWALGFLEDVDLADSSNEVLRTFATEDYGSPKKAAVKVESGLVPQLSKPGQWKYRERVIPNLRWTKEPVTRVLEIFRMTPEIFNLQDNVNRLDNQRLVPDTDISKFYALHGKEVTLDRRKGESGYMVLFDLGRMSAGDFSFEVETDSAAVMDLATTELLRDGKPRIGRGGSHYYCRYHLETGLNKFRIFAFSGFRYAVVILKDFTGKFRFKNLMLHECHADLEYTPVPVMNDRLQEQIYDISRRSLILNTQAQIYDCNTREHGSYWGDGLWTSAMVGHLTGNFSYMKQFCYAMEDEMPEDGIMNASLVGIGGILLDYSLIPPIVMDRYYAFTKDEATVKPRIPVCNKILGAFRKLKDESGLISQKRLVTDRSVYLFLDHSGMGWHPRTTVGIDRDDYNAGLNCFYLLSMMSVNRLNKELGLKDDLEPEIADLRGLLKKHFLDSRCGLVVDAWNPGKKDFGFSQITNALAVLAGVLEGDQARKALRQVADVRKNSWISQGTPYTYFYLFDAMISLGMVEEALEISKQYWQPMVERGATTTWEAFNDECHDSLNHAWSAPLLYLSYAGVCGIRGLEPGYGKLELKPQLTAFDEFSGEYCIPQGKVDVHWKHLSQDEVELGVRVPSAVKAEIVLGEKRIPFQGTWKGKI